MNEINDTSFEEALNSIKTDFDKDLEILSKQSPTILSEQQEREVQEELEVIDGSSNKARGGSGI